ncbi:MAG TPA: hypothetical protein VIO94_04290, partial [Phenylobacterium sp.]
VVAVEAPLDDAAWEALVDRETEDRDGDESRNYTRANDDMETAVTRKGVRYVAAWHSRDTAMVRMAYRYPADDETFGRFEPILLHTFRVADELPAQR